MKVPANKPGMVAVRPQSYARGKTRGAWRQTERAPDKFIGLYAKPSPAAETTAE